MPNKFSLSKMKFGTCLPTVYQVKLVDGILKIPRKWAFNNNWEDG